jgi:hypothetical protein
MNLAKKVGIGLVILIFSLFLVLYGPTYIIGSTQQVQRTEWNYEMNSSQLEIANKLWDTNVTVGEFFEKTNPEFLRTMPGEMKQYLYAKKMEWPRPCQ